jgi:transposase
MPNHPARTLGNRVHETIRELLEQELLEARGRSREELIAEYASDGLTEREAEEHVDLLMKDLAERQAREEEEARFMRTAALSREHLEADLRGLGMERFRRIYAERGVKVEEAGGSGNT